MVHMGGSFDRAFWLLTSHHVHMQVRTLPAVLKYLPSEKAQDARNFVQSLQYWLGGNAENLENLLLNTASSYVPALKGVDIDVLEPQLFPDVGIWHPMALSKFTPPSAHSCLNSVHAFAFAETLNTWHLA